MIIFEQGLITELLNPSSVLGAVFYALVFLLITFLVSSLIRRYVKEIIRRGSGAKADRTSVIFIGQLGNVAVFLIGAILYFHLIPALRAFGTALLTTASVASIVVGLAAQNTLGNIIAGVSLLLYRPFMLRDEVEVTAPGLTQAGRIVSITLGHTILEGPDNIKIIVPNSLMATSVIINRGEVQVDAAR
jgi:small conductance mechanosensitive channel